MPKGKTTAKPKKAAAPKKTAAPKKGKKKVAVVEEEEAPEIVIPKKTAAKKGKKKVAVAEEEEAPELTISNVYSVGLKDRTVMVVTGVDSVDSISKKTGDPVHKYLLVGHSQKSYNRTLKSGKKKSGYVNMTKAATEEEAKDYARQLGVSINHKKAKPRVKRSATRTKKSLTHAEKKYYTCGDVAINAYRRCASSRGAKSIPTGDVPSWYSEWAEARRDSAARRSSERKELAKASRKKKAPKTAPAKKATGKKKAASKKKK